MGATGLLLERFAAARHRSCPKSLKFHMPSRKDSARKPLARFTSITNVLHRFARPTADGVQVRIYWTLVAFLALVFLMGGASRADVQSLVVLRPLAVLVCGFALLTLKREQLVEFRMLTGIALLLFLVAGLHLIPLPPAIWQSLPGRDVIVGIDAAAGIKNVWRPLTMTPTQGWNAFFALFVPLAALLMAIQLSAEYLRKLVLPVLVLGLLSGVIGIFQSAGDPHGALYFYRITNNGSAVGLFSNRNHQAVFLATLFPLLALFASKPMKTENGIKLRLALCVGAAVLIIPLLLVTGSRLGLILGTIGIAAGWFIYQRPEPTGVRRRTERKSHIPTIIGGIAVVMIGLMTVMASRAEAIKRLVGMNVGEEDRAQAWGLVWRMTLDHLPWGSGSGSFVEMFRRVEPVSSLSPVYFNHAHNDWLEVLLTFGIPGALLMLVAMATYLMGLRQIPFRGSRRDSDIMAQAGAVILLLFALASVVDYPLRTPSLACLFVVACCWMYSGTMSRSISTGNGRGD
jgi:O-antigen ligase